MRAFLAAIAALGVVAFGAAAGVRAQEAFPGTSYITPFPAGDTYRMQVYGDAFAEGLLGGLVDTFASETRVHQLAERAERATSVDDRVEVYAQLLVTCASCHGIHHEIWGPPRE